MLRFTLALAGLSAAIVASAIYWDKKRANRRVPAKKAAAMLQSAWADYHTRA